MIHEAYDEAKWSIHIRADNGSISSFICQFVQSQSPVGAGNWTKRALRSCHHGAGQVF